MSLAIINDIFCGFDHLFDRDQFWLVEWVKQ
jgi:hypothetical protein